MSWRGVSHSYSHSELVEEFLSDYKNLTTGRDPCVALAWNLRTVL
jgi:hypothetical protein